MTYLLLTSSFIIKNIVKVEIKKVKWSILTLK